MQAACHTDRSWQYAVSGGSQLHLRTFASRRFYRWACSPPQDNELHFGAEGGDLSAQRMGVFARRWISPPRLAWGRCCDLDRLRAGTIRAELIRAATRLILCDIGRILPQDPRRTGVWGVVQCQPEVDRGRHRQDSYFFHSQGVGGCLHNAHQLPANSL